MIDRKHIEQFLRLNGLDTTSADEEIRSLLVSARWQNDDVEAALVVLREDAKQNTRRIDSVHKVIETDQKLSSEALNSLLGMDVEVQSIVTARQQNMEDRYRFQMIAIAVYSVVGAIILLVLVMWFMKVGIFHEYALRIQ